jgi:hypothetical protein
MFDGIKLIHRKYISISEVILLLYTMMVMNLDTPKATAKRELVANTPTSGKFEP